MPIPNGVFDNRGTMQREAWIDGEMAAQWPALLCEDMSQTLLPWEREVLERHWGYYANPPRGASE